MNLDLIRRWKFINSCILLTPEIRFQCWSSKDREGEYFSPKQYTHKEWKDLEIVHLMYKESELLRQSIETKDITELRMDLDHDIDTSIKYAIKIYSQLKRHKIVSSVYYSGGKGIHIHALLSLKNINNLKYNNFDIDLNIFNNEFNEKVRKKNKTFIATTYDLVQARSLERRNIKHILCNELGFIEKIDKLLLFSTQQLTLEGSVKRHSKNKFHVNKKIYINLESEDTLEKIKDYIERNKLKTIINREFFNQINILSDKLTTIINKKLSTLEKKPKLQERKESKLNKCITTSDKVSNIGREETTPINEDIFKAYSLALIELYNKCNIKSLHQYSFYLIKLFDTLTKGNKILTLKYCELICKSLNISTNLGSQLENINYNGCWFGFKHQGKIYYNDEDLNIIKIKYLNIIGSSSQ